MWKLCFDNMTCTCLSVHICQNVPHYEGRTVVFNNILFVNVSDEGINIR